MTKIKNGGLDQDGAEPFEQQQFGVAGVIEGVKRSLWLVVTDRPDRLKAFPRRWAAV